MNLCEVATALNWGSVPDWGAAIGTVGAVIFTLRAASSADRQRRADERRHLQASARAIIINISEIINDLLSVRKAFIDNIGSIFVIDEKKAVKCVEFYKAGVGMSSIKEVELQERQLDLLEKDPMLSSDYRLAIRRHRAHIVSIIDYSVKIEEMKELRELIRSEQDGGSIILAGRNENLRLRAENVKSLGEEIFYNIAKDIVSATDLADALTDIIKPLFHENDFPHIDTDSLRAGPIFPNNL